MVKNSEQKRKQILKEAFFRWLQYELLTHKLYFDNADDDDDDDDY